MNKKTGFDKKHATHRPKFSVQQGLQDFTSKIRRVLDHTLCEKHDAVRYGQPCWWLHEDNGTLRSAVCNQRARKIFTGVPSERASMNHREYKRSQKEKTE